jgi:hypothetical protein
VNSASRLLLTLCLVFGLSVLGGCKKDTVVDDYVSRLQNVLDIDDSSLALFSEANSVNQNTYLRPPSRRELILPLSAPKISIREFLALRQCELHLVIAHRNSLMGKVAENSQLFLNDLDILHTGPKCLNILKNDSQQIDEQAQELNAKNIEKIKETEQSVDTELVTKLQTFLSTKKQEIKSAYWNATIASKEYQSFWSIGSLAENYPNELKRNTAEDFDQLIKLVAQFEQDQFELSDQDKKAFENTLGNIRLGDGGQLLLEYEKLQKGLLKANAIIQYRLQSGQHLCLSAQPNSKANNFQNVVLNYFIANVQSFAVQLDKRRLQILPIIESFESVFSEIAPKIFLKWQQQRHNLLKESKQVLTQHALLINELFKQCGLQAGNK